MDNLKQVKKNYNLFNTFRSTGFLVPILYLFIESKIGLSVESIVKIASFYILLPFFIEVPLGYLGDKIGNKKVIQFGLVMQIASCLSLLFLNGELAYHAYLISIYVAAASYSGADKALINPYFKESKDFRNFLVKIGGELYRNSIVFLLIGTAAYQVDLRLPVLIQAIAFMISLYGVSKIEEIQKSKHSEVNPLKDFTLISKFLLKNPGYLSLAVLISVFSAAIALNHKTIQASLVAGLETFISSGSIWMLGVSYSIGNLLSWKGSKIFLASGIKDKSLPIQLTLISLIGVVSFLMMTALNPIAIFLGFMTLNIFKSLFRPVIGAELSSRFPVASLKASALSVVSVLSALISASIHFFMAPAFEVASEGNLTMTILMVLIAIPAIIIIKNSNKVTLYLGSMSLTGKENFITQENDKKSFIQKYPEATDKIHFNQLEKVVQMDLYPHPINSICGTKKIVASDYIEGGELRRNDDHLALISNFLDARNDGENAGHYSSTPEVDEIFESNIPENLLNKITDGKYWGNVHGDLHPGNLVLSGDEIKAIDWDLSGEGYIWFDYLTLLTHPWTRLNSAERLNLFRKKFVEFNETDVKILFDSFRAFKSKQLKKFAKFDSSLNELVNQYQRPLEY